MSPARASRLSLTTPGRLRLYSTQELLRLPSPRWQVQDILPAGGLVGLYGQPGTGKSFIAIDLAMCVASGLPWHGHQVIQQGFVLYISAEGGTGIGKRVQAWLSSNGVSPDAAHIGWLIEAIPINNDSEDMDILFERLGNELEINPSLVIIDTLARCFDGDENQQEDMGRFVAGADRIRQEFKSTVIVVHHTRLDGERERGNTAFRGAADTMCAVERKNGVITLKCNKQKDAEEFVDHAFALSVIPQHESCVIRDFNQSKDNEVLVLIRNGVSQYAELKRQSGITNIIRPLRRLLESGEIIKENDEYFTAQGGDTKG